LDGIGESYVKTLKLKTSNHFFNKLFLIGLVILSGCYSSHAQKNTTRYLYVAEPGIRNYLEYGGHGILVYDINNDYKLVKRIPTGSFDSTGHPSNVKGIAVSLATQNVYVSTIKSLLCISLTTDKLLWEIKPKLGCDRMDISPDGLTIFQSSFEKDYWYIIDAKTGKIKDSLLIKNKAHNTLFSRTGKQVYLEGLGSSSVTVVNPKKLNELKTIGPFTAPVRPFTLNGKETLLYANVNDLLGFEIADLKTGKMIHRLEVPGFSKGMIKRHGCPSHGIGVTPNEKEVWVADGANQRMHIYDNTQMPPVYIESIELRDQPGWITFSLDGKHAWPSTGEIIDIKTKKIIKRLADEKGEIVQSEKIVEIHFKNGKAVTKGNQFGVGMNF
jgi:DNA-binding beta-propeller fold protein YncE